MTATASFSRRSAHDASATKAPTTAIGRSETIPRALRARDARSGGSALLRASRRRPPRHAARGLEQSVARRGRREGASTIAMQVARMQNPGAARASRDKIMEAATALALIARHGHEATLAQYLRLAPYGAEQPWRRPRRALLFRQAGRGSLLGRDGAARRHSAVAGPHEPRARERPRRARRRAPRARSTNLKRRARSIAAQAALAQAQLAAMKPLAPPRRPETLHLALRYERLAREGRIEAASPYDPRIHATHRSWRRRGGRAISRGAISTAFAAPARGRSR